jgi:hypothetical protein
VSCYLVSGYTTESCEELELHLEHVEGYEPQAVLVCRCSYGKVTTQYFLKEDLVWLAKAITDKLAEWPENVSEELAP